MAFYLLLLYALAFFFMEVTFYRLGDLNRLSDTTVNVFRNHVPNRLGKDVSSYFRSRELALRQSHWQVNINYMHRCVHPCVHACIHTRMWNTTPSLIIRRPKLSAKHTKIKLMKNKIRSLILVLHPSIDGWIH